jgi:hypothetical protein
VVVGEVGTVPITSEKLLHALRLREMERELGREEEEARKGAVPAPRRRSSRGEGGAPCGGA